MRDAREAVNGRAAQGAVDEEGIVVCGGTRVRTDKPSSGREAGLTADKSKRDDANRLEDAAVDEERAGERAAHFGGDARALGDDRDDDDNHADESKSASFSKLVYISLVTDW